jgi:hypothetical protein
MLWELTHNPSGILQTVSGEQMMRIEYHFLRPFGDVSARVDAGWGDRGGAAERERFPAVKRVVAQIEQGLYAAARARSARQEAGC